MIKTHLRLNMKKMSIVHPSSTPVSSPVSVNIDIFELYLLSCIMFIQRVSSH